MGKRYRKMAKKANGKVREIRDGQVIIEMPLPVADVLVGIPEAVEGLSQEVGLMLIWAVITKAVISKATKSSFPRKREFSDNTGFSGQAGE